MGNYFYPRMLTKPKYQIGEHIKIFPDIQYLKKLCFLSFRKVCSTKMQEFTKNKGRPGTWETEIQLREGVGTPRMTEQKNPRAKQQIHIGSA